MTMAIKIQRVHYLSSDTVVVSVDKLQYNKGFSFLSGHYLSTVSTQFLSACLIGLELHVCLLCVFMCPSMSVVQ